MERIPGNEYGVIVIGAGHAGCESALASARNGSKTLLITISMDSIALLACNGAVGGPGRGQLVREIDALGGEIGKNVDKSYIHNRMLNISKGPALRTVRAIVDKKRYFLYMKQVLENQENLDLRQGLVAKIEKFGNKYKLITTDESFYVGKCIVIATGTFLRGKIFWGKYEREAGRQGEINSIKLPGYLENMGYKFGRLRTETPPRVDKKTVDFNNLRTQKYDEIPEMFSFDNVYDGREQLNNHITYAEKECIDFIIKNIEKSSIYEMSLKSESPKYCPSIEDKVNRFKNRKRHQIFVQPEGKDTNEMYLHGLFTTFSEDIQEGIIKRIKGLEKAEITRPGYGVEYDYLIPGQLNINLESKKHKNIFFAGQINGTTGYEEAAAQGIITGINASLSSGDKENIFLSREDGYIGILIDDVILKGVTEPYRMLTSRNEFRLYHRHDNADIRMSKILKKIGHEKKANIISKKYEKIDEAYSNINKSKYFNSKKMIEDIKQDRLSKNNINIIKNTFNLDDKELNSLIINIKYEIYLKREIDKIENFKTYSNLKIPKDINYQKIKNVSKEAVLSLERYHPGTIQQASRLVGVKPLDIFILVAYISNVSRETLKNK
jgi:tRNA uridine 5-carboxymethylaminomethyl modification enzyme